MTNFFVNFFSWILGIPPDWDTDWEARQDRDVNDWDD
jgi:hypothetical protein